MRKIFFGITLVLLIFNGSAALPQSPIGECDCNVTAYLVDPDESGTNVRTSPGGKIVKKLPLLTDPEFETGVLLKIKASRNGWLQIDEVIDSIDPQYHDTWVFGKLVGMRTRVYDNRTFEIYTKPSKTSKVAGILRGEIDVLVLGCCRDWVYIQTTNESGKVVKGWLEPDLQCPAAVTTCP